MFLDGQPCQRLTLGTLGRQIHLRGLLGHRSPIEGRSEPFPGGIGAPLRCVGIVEHGAHRVSEPGHVARRIAAYAADDGARAVAAQRLRALYAPQAGAAERLARSLLAAAS